MINFEGFKHIGVVNGVCGNRPVILGTRLEPFQIVEFGTKEEVLEHFEYLTVEQVEECYRFVERLHVERGDSHA